MCCSVFATRLATSKPIFDQHIRQFRYDRFAAKLDNGSMEAYEVDAVRGLMKVPWPELRKKDLGAGECCVHTKWVIAHHR